GVLAVAAMRREPHRGAARGGDRPGGVPVRFVALAERLRPLHRAADVERSDPLDIVLGPAPRPALDPATDGSRLHTGASMRADRLRILLISLIVAAAVISFVGRKQDSRVLDGIGFGVFLVAVG